MSRRRTKPSDCAPASTTMVCAYGEEIITVRARLNYTLGIIAVCSPLIIVFGAWMVLELQKVQVQLVEFSYSMALVINDTKASAQPPPATPKQETAVAATMAMMSK